ncbi:MAG: adenosine deaminase [Pseudomonadota bacterium]
MSNIDPATAAIPKVELHLHLEGAASPDLVRRLAARNSVTLPDDLFDEDGEYLWNDFLHFLKVFDAASSVIRTPEDYRDLTYEYLVGSAAEGGIYAELMSSPDHAALAGMSYTDHLDGIAQGIEDAKRDSGIEARIIVTCVRQFGVERCLSVARDVVRHPHKLVTGFGMGGDEAGFPPEQFAEVFRIAHEEAGLQCNAHAGEFGGPESVRGALNSLPVTRLGHGVRSIEDPALVEELAERGTVLEVCPMSNIATGVYPTFDQHPLPTLMEAGVRCTLSSDDPPYFASSIGREYQNAKSAFGFDDTTLLGFSRTSLEAAFIDDPTRAALMAKLDQ